MNAFNFVLAYVDDATKSADLYGKLLNARPAESSPNFAMFKLPSGITLGLWGKTDVQPKATTSGGGVELAFPVTDRGAVTKTRDEWADLGLKIIQEPTQMDFGFTFTAADPDGHRLRVFAPGQA